jgi:hypothetical protein
MVESHRYVLIEMGVYPHGDEHSGVLSSKQRHFVFILPFRGHSLALTE